MKRLIAAGVVSLSLALAGCGGEAEEAPDITQAIPLDPEGSDTASEDASSGADELAGYGADDSTFAQGEAANGADTPDLPGSSGSGERALPDSMERGANPPGMTQPPAGSKVQPAGR